MRAILTLILSASALASAQEITIKKITGDHSKFLATGSGIETGQTYNLNSDTSVCSAQVVKTNGRTAIMKVTSCDDRNALKNGDFFTLAGAGDMDSMDSLAPRRAKSSSDKFGMRYGAGLLYSTANKINYELKGGGFSNSAEVASDPAFGIDGSFHWFRPMNIGGSARVTYELPRKLKSLKVGTGTLDLDNYSAAIVVFEASANFTFDMGAYAYAGVNYPYFMITWPGTTLSGGIGYHAGGGYLITNEIGVDLQMRFLRASGDFKNGVLTQTLENMRMDGFILTGNYYFDHLF